MRREQRQRGGEREWERMLDLSLLAGVLRMGLWWASMKMRTGENTSGIASAAFNTSRREAPGVRTEATLRDRFGKIINSSLRRVIATVPLRDVLSEKRDNIMAEIQQVVAGPAESFGIKIVDVRIGRTELPTQTRQSVFSRMRTEREREARELRAEGGEEAQKIRAQADLERTVLIADAERQAQIMRGEGEGGRNLVLGKAYGRDPEFFDFYKSLAEYQKNLVDSDTTMVLSPDSEFFRFFGSGGGSNPKK